jgi:hypothetical protein
MVDQTAIVLGVGISSFLLFYLSNSFGDSENDLGRQVLKLLSVGFGVVLLLIIPQTLFISDICEPVVKNASVAGNLTTYEYASFCYTEENAAVGGFYKTILVFFRVFVIVLLLRVGWMVILSIKSSIGRRMR